MTTAPTARPRRVSLPQKLRESQRCVLGTWVKIPALETVEMLADAGYDFIIVDLEHSPMSLESCYRATVVAQALGMHVLVRTADRSGNYIQRLLDSGVDGVMVPQVSSAEEARRVIRDMVFAPEGRRGAGSTSRAGMWGDLPGAEYRRRGTDEIVRGFQLEDVPVLEDVDAVLDTPGLNAAFLGTGDLAMSSGLSPGDPAFEALIDRFLAAAKARDLPRGTAVGTGEAARRAADRGFTFVMISNDAKMFGDGARAALASARTPGP